MEFKNFMKNSNFAEKYISVEYDERTMDNLREWCARYNISHNYRYDGTPATGPFTFHTTVIFSTTKHSMINRDVYLKSEEVTPKSFGFLGIDRKIPVIHLNHSPQISAIREQYKRLYKIEESFPNYLPHISLSYDPVPDDLFEGLTLPTFPLVYNKMVIRDADA